jgi:hypothetical protein
LLQHFNASVGYVFPLPIFIKPPYYRGRLEQNGVALYVIASASEAIP